MKISELRPCDNCNGKIVPMFYVIRISLAMVNPQAGNQVMGMVQMFGGLSNPGALAIAETMAPEADCVKVLGDEDPELMTEIRVCQTCYTEKDLNFAMLAEKVSDRKKSDSES